jgi:hypothetical protein
VIESLNLFSSEECSRIGSIIHNMDCHWDRRIIMVPFFTLGTPAYMDANPHDLQNSYLSKVSQRNPVLSENLGWMYGRMVECLSNHFSAPVILHPRYSLPGFHIYLYDDCFSRDDITSIHFDLQFQRLTWEEKVDFDNSLSLTMAVTLPHNGGGMFYWDLQHSEAEKWNSQKINEMRQSRTRNYFAYEPGNLVLHSGNFLHQVAPFQEPTPEDERITLQGHLAFYLGSWHLYW